VVEKNLIMHVFAHVYVNRNDPAQLKALDLLRNASWCRHLEVEDFPINRTLKQEIVAQHQQVDHTMYSIDSAWVASRCHLCLK
jgi:hypothetical protein